MLLEWFRSILRLQLFSRAQSRSLICCCSREHSFSNFRAWSLSILFILPNDTTRAIWCNSAIPTFFVRALALVYVPLIPGALLFEFSCEIDSYIIYLVSDNTRAILQNSETRTFFARALALFNLPILSGALLFEFSHNIASNFIYLT